MVDVAGSTYTLTSSMNESQVLIACESSQIVTKALRDIGIEAYSCDLLPGEINKDWHIQGDIRDVNLRDYVMVGSHLPCTFMCNSGVSWLHKDESRWNELQKSNELFHYFWQSGVKHLYIENPIPHKYALLPDYSQIVHPYQFGHPERKATCLWLKNLPLLKETNNVKDVMEKLPKKEAQRIHYTSPGKDRWKIRSRTFPGIAKAIADQWGKILLNEMVIVS